uniref:Origin recognition complex subunit 3 n=1 Tax=Culicoides sonorensis TaxID=179676 RepID=A0A336LPV0_CULSO
METVSISKGIFVFKNGATSAKRKKSKSKSSSKPFKNLLDTESLAAPWYQAYNSLWTRLDTKIDELQKQSYNKIYQEFTKFVQECNCTYSDTIPTAALLTGINQSDHISQFNKLCVKLRSELDALIVVLESRHCPTPKAAIETIVNALIDASESMNDQDDEEEIKLKRNQLNIWCLMKWYEKRYEHIDLQDRPKLIIMMPDFEGFLPEVLQNLILVLHGYQETLPFIFVFGVATSFDTIHETLPFNVTNKISVKVFLSEASPVTLNQVIDQVILAHDCPFHLSGTTFRMLTDIFLFYDFSVHGFVQGFKYCMLEHFSQGNIYALSSNDLNTQNLIQNLNHEEMEEIRSLHSFRKFVETRENPKEIIQLLTNDEYLQNSLPKFIDDLNAYWKNFHCSLEVIFQLCANLPKNHFGKHLREFYRTCISIDVSESTEYKEIVQLLTFMSRDEILEKIQSIVKVLEKYTIDKNSSFAKEFREDLLHCMNQIEAASMEVPCNENDQNPVTNSLKVTNRFELKEKLLQAAKQPKSVSPFTKIVTETVEKINKFISLHLRPLSKAPPLFELFVFMDHVSVKRHIMGVPRAAIHQALNNPAHYLQCDCCEIENDESTLLPTMPDISIVYKLHLECGKMINMFDWLQSFKIVVDEKSVDEEDEDDTAIDPQIQARFTKAVAELQFLGFIKPTKKKTDHVQRLTW